MPSTKDKKDKMGEKQGQGQNPQNPQTPYDRKKEGDLRENEPKNEGISRDKSREQTAGTGRKME